MIDIWIPLTQELPKPGEKVWWYDAMFNKISYFAMARPEAHDGDYTHFARIAAPIKYRQEGTEAPALYVPLAINISTLKAAFHPHPGTMLHGELTVRGITFSQFVKKSKIPLHDALHLLQGKKNIDQEIASKLQKALGIDRDVWINLQKVYDEQ